MIPLQITLKNFLSYREATLDFRGLHTACICGANGAGKSSLLEAITWVVWGKTRAATEDDVIHAGVNHVRVDFDFNCYQQTYRIIRSRSRGKSSALEFQVATESGRFRSITAKGMKATQEEIITALKLDYDTFINSAYLRQGRADEFMLRRPSDRKQILADLLKLDRYEQLAIQSKDLAKEYKGQAEQVRQSLTTLEEQLAQEKITQEQLVGLENQIKQLQQLQEQTQIRLHDLQVIEHQRQGWEQQISVQQTQHQNLIKDCDRLKQDLSFLQIQLQQLQQLIAREAQIVEQYNQLLSWQEQEKDYSDKFVVYQQSQKQLTELEQQLERQNNELNLQVRQVQTRLEAIEQQEQEIEHILARSSEVEAGLSQLHQHRQRLIELDKIQQYVAPLLQQKNNLRIEIERIETKLTIKLEQIQQASEQLSEQIAKVPQVRQAVLTIDAQIDELDKKKVYQKRVRDKGEERKDFQNSLQANHAAYERQFQELQQKLDLLGIPEALCPLCERELDEHHRNHVIDKTTKQQKETQEQIWVIREQLAACERELQLLRKEYKEIDQELHPYDSLQLQLGQLEAQLEASGEIHKQLKNFKSEQEELQRLLVSGNYAEEFQFELNQLNAEIKNLEYDEQTHALIRGEVERWRWAEIKQAKIEDAKKRQANIDSQKPQFLEQINKLEREIEQLHTTSEIYQQIEQVRQTIAQLNYDRTEHQNLLTQLRQAQNWYIRHQELTKAKQEYPQLQTRLQELQQLLQLRLQDKSVSQTQIDNYITQRERINDYSQEIETLEKQIHQRRQQLDLLIIQTGRLQQTLVQIKELKNQYQTSCQQLKQIDKNYRVYQELGQAFGKNGIQALMIENILPQLEAETNHILARLTGNQFHVQFLTQKAGKSSSKKTTKLIDTLDILIADARGTRPYETYSGGEAFRINFSIRLALAKLLAQRAGTSLQLLIVDEGFGTQDGEGCERLVAAINAIASDFACILTVTHMPQFKEAFQTRIEVYKSDRGSSLHISN